MGAASTGDDSKANFREADFGIQDRDATVTAHCDFKASAKCATVQRCDRRLSASLKAVDDNAKERALGRLADL